MTSRNGRHKDSKILFGGMFEPEQKAIAIVTAAVYAGRGAAMTQTDIIWKGIQNLAIAVGVLDKEGRVTEAFKDSVTIATEAVISTNKSNRGSRGGRRKSK